jgi:hypothetical protein
LYRFSRVPEKHAFFDEVFFVVTASYAALPKIRTLTARPTLPHKKRAVAFFAAARFDACAFSYK